MSSKERGAGGAVGMGAGSEIFTMRQVSKMLGVKARTLRGYCNSGFVSGRVLMGRGRRTFTSVQVEQLKIVHWLSRAGFTKKDLRKYMLLGRSSNAKATEERIAMLRTHKRQVWQELEDLQATIDFLERQEELLR